MSLHGLHLDSNHMNQIQEYAFFSDPWFPRLPPCLWALGDHYRGVPQGRGQVHGCAQVKVAVAFVALFVDVGVVYVVCWQVQACAQMKIALKFYRFLFCLLQPLRLGFRSLPLCVKPAVWSSWRGVRGRGRQPHRGLPEGAVHQRNWDWDHPPCKDGRGSLLCPFWNHRLWGRRNLPVCHAMVFASDQGDSISFYNLHFKVASFFRESSQCIWRWQSSCLSTCWLRWCQTPIVGSRSR